MSSYQIITCSGKDRSLEPYLAMIMSDFMKSLKYGNDWYKLIDSAAYFKAYEQVIAQILSRDQTLVRLACLTEDIDNCLGWSISEGNKLHYVFVKKDFKRQGIARSLMPKEFDEVTHLTKIGQVIRSHRFPKVIFNPFI